MSDIMSSETRSRLMARIRAKNTRPEVLLRRALHGTGISFRSWARDLPGTPDLVSPEAKVVVFVDGCFWHGCPTHYQPPTTRSAFWKRKLMQNRNRRIRVLAELELMGWTPLEFWECEVESAPNKIASLVTLRIAQLTAGLGSAESNRRPRGRRRAGKHSPPEKTASIGSRRRRNHRGRLEGAPLPGRSSHGFRKGG